MFLSPQHFLPSLANDVILCSCEFTQCPPKYSVSLQTSLKALTGESRGRCAQLVQKKFRGYKKWTLECCVNYVCVGRSSHCDEVLLYSECLSSAPINPIWKKWTLSHSWNSDGSVEVCRALKGMQTFEEARDHLTASNFLITFPFLILTCGLESWLSG